MSRQEDSCCCGFGKLFRRKQCAEDPRELAAGGTKGGDAGPLLEKAAKPSAAAATSEPPQATIPNQLLAAGGAAAPAAATEPPVLPALPKPGSVEQTVQPSPPVLVAAAVAAPAGAPAAAQAEASQSAVAAPTSALAAAPAAPAVAGGAAVTAGAATAAASVEPALSAIAAAAAAAAAAASVTTPAAAAALVAAARDTAPSAVAAKAAFPICTPSRREGLGGQLLPEAPSSASPPPAAATSAAQALPSAAFARAEPQAGNSGGSPLKAALGPASLAAVAAGKAHERRGPGGPGSPPGSSPAHKPKAGALRGPSKDNSLERQPNANGSIVVIQDPVTETDSDDEDSSSQARQEQASSPDSATSPGQQPKLGFQRSGGLKTVKSSPAVTALNQKGLTALNQKGSGVSPNAANATNRQNAGAIPLKFTEMDAEMAARLDKFFQDDTTWRRIVVEVDTGGALGGPRLSAASRRGGICTFRVRVPKPYPGLQYRRSRDLNDKCQQKFAENNTIVTGTLVDGGEWLQVSPSEYLPTRVGMVSILEEVVTAEDKKEPCSCSNCNFEDKQANVEVVVNRGGPGRPPS